MPATPAPVRGPRSGPVGCLSTVVKIVVQSNPAVRADCLHGDLHDRIGSDSRAACLWCHRAYAPTHDTAMTSAAATCRSSV
jgi:hypothetical protein